MNLLLILAKNILNGRDLIYNVVLWEIYLQRRMKMFKSKKIFKILLAVSLTSSILVGCGAKTEVVPVRLETPEEVVDTFIKDLKENNTSEMARLYADVYVDSTGYDLYTIEKILSKSRKESELVDIELTNMED